MNKKVMFVIVSIAAIVTILFMVSCRPSTTSAEQQSKAGALTDINNEKVLKVGYIVFPPCVTKDPKTGKLGGHFVAAIEEITREAGWKVKFEESDWSTFVAGLNTKRYDVSIAPTFVTIPRALAISFTQPLFYAGNSAVVKKGEMRFKTINSLDKKGIKIAVTQGEAGYEYVKSNFKNAEIIVESGSDELLTFQDVLTGRADAALGDAYVTSKYAAQHPDSVIDLFAANPYNLTPVSWAVRQEDGDLLNFLNSSIEALRAQGKLLDYETEAGAHWLHFKQEWDSQL